ncbi:helix-turn-helix domain-containing protein [Jeotgalibacillus campisalis]|uniref:HTH cro/C1-type domain-containing protein n=1 Tax=Jeotgalibacillus campisalis TaxID=220754 RepID=A0A0C2V1G1_9BACL|nr:helix-turn-helix transcriptional regulator [Jeotgalibacillus campisalis]KIL42907.1 hypothetical protein KR50_33100 [Jeotgalibacillus campisalis]
MNEDVNLFGKKIKDLRKNKRMTQKAMAQKLGLSESSVRMWELGKNKPSPETIQEISKVLNAELYELLKLGGYNVLVNEIIKMGGKNQSFLEESQSQYRSDNHLNLGNKKDIDKLEVNKHEVSLDEREGIITRWEDSEELRKRLFDLHFILHNNQFKDVYYKKKLLTIDEKQKIESMLEIILTQE